MQESLCEADTLAHEMKVSCSGLFVAAPEDYIGRDQNQRLLARINEAYEGPLDPDERKRLQSMRRHDRRIVEGEW